MSQNVSWGTSQHDPIGLESGLEALQASSEFRGPVESLGDHHCNDHFAQIYESRAEKFAAAVPFVRQGLERGERCMYVVDEASEEEVLVALREAGVDADAALESGALTLHTIQDTYLKDGSFDPDEMIAFYATFVEEATEEYEALRVTAETTWLQEETTTIEDFMEYESKVNDLFAEEDCLALCQYDRNGFPPEVIRNIVQTHPHLIYDGTVCHNFYYTPPAEFFGPEQPASEVDRMLGTLRDWTVAKAELAGHKRFLHELYGITACQDRSFEEKLHALFELGCEQFDLDLGALNRVDPDGDRLEIEYASGNHSHFEAGRELPLSQTYCRAATDIREAASVSDPVQEGYGDVLVYEDFGVGGYLGTYVPVEGGADRTLAFVPDGSEVEPFSEQDRTYLELMGQWVGSELNRQQREAFLRECNEITSDPDHGFEAKLERLVELGCERFGLDAGGLCRVDADSDFLEVETVVGDHDVLEPGLQADLTETYCQVPTAASQDSDASVTDPVDVTDPEPFEGKLCYDVFGIRTYLGTHLELDGASNRTFWLVSNEPRDEPITDEERTFHRLMGQWVKYELERQQRERFLRECYEITAAPTPGFEEKLDALFELGCEQFDLDHGGIARIDQESDRFEVERIRGEHDHLVPGKQFPLSETYCRLASEDGETAAVTDPVGAGFEGKLCYDQFGVRTYLGTHLPIDGDDDRTFWFLSNEPRDGPITEAECTFTHLMGQWVKYELERRQHEQELRRTKNRFETVFENSNDAIFLLDPYEDELVDVNPAGVELVGYDYEELLAHGPSDLHPDEMEQFRAFVDTVFENGHGWTEELTCRAKDGETIPAEISASALELEDRSLMLAHVRDVTERKKHERYQRELYDITADPARSFDEKLQTLFDLGCDRFGLELGGMARVDPATDRFEIEYVSGDHEYLEPGAQVALSETYCRLVADGAGTAYVTDPADSELDDTISYDEFGVNTYLGTYVELDGDLDRTFFFVSSEQREEPFSEEERTFHRLMGQWMKYELERQQREDQFAALNDVSRELMNAGTQAEIADVIVEHAQGSLQLPVTALVNYDKRRGTLSPVAQTPYAEDELPTAMLCAPESGPLWETFVANETLILDDVADIDGAGDDLAEVVAVPLGREGLFVTATRTSDGFGSAGLDFVQATAATVKAAFTRADREQQLSEREATLEEQNRTLERLNRVNDIIRNIDKALVQASTRTEIETVVCEQLADVGPYELAWIGEHDPVTDEITPRRWAGTEKGYLEEITVTADHTSGGQGPGGRAVRTREPQVVNNVLDDPGFEPYRQAALNRGYHACISLPLVYEGSLYGILTVYAGRPDVFGELEGSVLTELSDTIAYAINAVESKKALVSQAVTELKFDVRDTNVDLVELSSELDCTITLEGVIPRTDGRLRIFFSVRGVPAATFADAAARLPVRDLSLISEHEEDGDPVGLFEGLPSDESFYARILEHGGIPREIVVGGEQAYVLVELAADAATREFVEMFRTSHPGAELVAQRTRERSSQSPTEVYLSLTDSLTDRQLEVLQTAYFSGYFEKPRTRTGSEIAASLDITQPTFNHHVRAAQRKFCRALFEDDGSLGVADYDVD